MLQWRDVVNFEWGEHHMSYAQRITADIVVYLPYSRGLTCHCCLGASRDILMSPQEKMIPFDCFAVQYRHFLWRRNLILYDNARRLHERLPTPTHGRQGPWWDDIEWRMFRMPLVSECNKVHQEPLWNHFYHWTWHTLVEDRTFREHTSNIQSGWWVSLSQ